MAEEREGVVTTDSDEIGTLHCHLCGVTLEGITKAEGEGLMKLHVAAQHKDDTPSIDAP